MRRLRPISHGGLLSRVDHLEELRFRIIVSLAAFGVALGLAFWQNRMLLHLAERPLGGRRLLTLGVAEPFTVSLTVAAYAALVLALPVVLYQLYAFIVPAFSTSERRVVMPLLATIPLLFVAGVSFSYLVVLPAALHFLFHFNSTQFDVQIRARDYLSFFGLTVVVGGLVFQTPVAIVALTRLGITTPQKLRRHRRHAIVAITVIAALLPGVDPVSMLLEMVPLIVLYELSILLAAAFGRPERSLRSASGTNSA